MKKTLLLVFSLFLITGCDVKEKKELENTKPDNPEIPDVLPVEEKYVDENPVIVGLYQNGKLVKALTTQIKSGVDIASFDVYFTNEENVGSTNTKRNFNKYAANYEDVSKYKIGFMVSLLVGDEIINKTILSPKDMYTLSPYIFNYLYDDVHQADGTWYDHVDAKDVNEKTIYSSIKLYAVDEVSKLSMPITLTVFTYDTEDDFDGDGMYRGNSKYTITINKK